MRILMKFIFVSFLLAVSILSIIQILLNPYRIGRILNLEIYWVEILSIILIFIIITFTTIFLNNILNKKIFIGNWNLLLIITWAPFFLILMNVVKSIFPFDRGEIVTPITGLFILAALIIYPIYLAIIIAYQKFHSKINL